MLYGKQGTLFLDLEKKKLMLGLKSEGGELKEVSVSEDKKERWKVCTHSSLQSKATPCITVSCIWNSAGLGLAKPSAECPIRSSTCTASACDSAGRRGL